MLVPLSNSKDFTSTRQSRPSSLQETTSWPSTRISTCLSPCFTFGKEIVASPTFLVGQHLRCLTRFSLVLTQALFTNQQRAPTPYNQYSIGIHPSHATSLRLKPSISRSPWTITHHRRGLSVSPSVIAYVTPSSLCRHSFPRRWQLLLLGIRENVKRRLGKRRISQRPLRGPR